MRLSDEILDRNVEAYRKIRNTFRYFLSNINDFDPGRDTVADSDLLELDRWAMVQLQDLIVGMVSSFEGYEFHAAHHALHNFCAVTMSSLYLDILKDRLYTSVPTSRERRSAQTALYRIAHAVCRLMAPILPFTAEEVWAHLPKDASDPESVHVALFPKPGISERIFAGDVKRAADFRRSWEKLLELREQVTRALEAERRSGTIGSPLEAAVTLAAAPEVFALLRDHLDDLPALFIVSKVDLEEAPRETHGTTQELSVSVRPAPGAKCARCWNIKETVGQDPDLPELCARCRGAVREILALRGGVH
jgi:isoleucyl-tRNA synthetase